uniref:Uncharacterized protein n=1 Tax=Ditylenchus dipsaci TaxID=166011 RepID=A0A915EH92_9BILA
MLSFRNSDSRVAEHCLSRTATSHPSMISLAKHRCDQVIRKPRVRRGFDVRYSEDLEIAEPSEEKEEISKKTSQFALLHCDCREHYEG